jgi:uncharacterized Zn finger protein
MSYYVWYPESRPIQTDRGLKARSRRSGFAKNWWAKRWIENLEQLMDAGRLRRGRRYARQGQVLSLEEGAGGVVAQVQGSRRKPYLVRIDLEPLRDAAWERVIDVLAERALFAARLLSGEMPEDIESAFSAAGASLFPERRGELRTECSCPDPARVCKHTAAVHYILGERFDEDPFLLFRLRGRAAHDVLPAIRERHGETGEPSPEPAAPPLEEEIDRFWEAGPGLDTIRISIKPPPVPLPALRRLGRPNFVTEDLPRQLSPAYEAISRSALETTLAEEGGED